MTARFRAAAITLNGVPTPLAEAATVADLLAALERDPRTVAVELNGKILPRPLYAETVLAHADRVEIVHFVQGG